jgi:hypothetical protein
MDMITYFSEEKIQNLFCMILGCLSLILALIFLFIIKYSFYKGMAVPLLLFGILQVTIGTIFFTSNTKILAWAHIVIKQKPVGIETREFMRMQNSLQNIQLHQSIEIVLVLTGLFLYLKFYKSSLTFWKGVGLGLLLLSSITLGLDIIAEKRAEEYAHYFNQE